MRAGIGRSGECADQFGHEQLPWLCVVSSIGCRLIRRIRTPTMQRTQLFVQAVFFQAHELGLVVGTLTSDYNRATHPCTSLNGHMFSCLHGHPSGSMFLRLPKGEREQFLKRYKTTLFVVHGIVRKEYVTVPDVLLKNTNGLQT
jgi:hypothetical protein